MIRCRGCGQHWQRFFANDEDFLLRRIGKADLDEVVAGDWQSMPGVMREEDAPRPWRADLDAYPDTLGHDALSDHGIRIALFARAEALLITATFDRGFDLNEANSLDAIPEAFLDRTE